MQVRQQTQQQLFGSVPSFLPSFLPSLSLSVMSIMMCDNSFVRCSNHAGKEYFIEERQMEENEEWKQHRPTNSLIELKLGVFRWNP
mmetsp:Transcript_20332/g.34722  ORF Transcript_20332/g.34722 Transcript_20332/m.34722 type:complete len:86 (+) Transcript_20332:98-355(+)